MDIFTHSAVPSSSSPCHLAASNHVWVRLVQLDNVTVDGAPEDEAMLRPVVMDGVWVGACEGEFVARRADL